MKNREQNNYLKFKSSFFLKGFCMLLFHLNSFGQNPSSAKYIVEFTHKDIGEANNRNEFYSGSYLSATL